MRVPPPIRLEHRDIFINLPVADLTTMREFYRALGWYFLEESSDDQTASFEIGKHLVVVLLEHHRFAERHGREATAHSGPHRVLNTITASNERDVKELVRRVRQAGGNLTREPETQGTKYGAAFEDPEGNGWEVVYFGPSAFD